MIKLYKGDCLIESDKIEDGSVDLILTDLPYGNMSMEGAKHGMTGKVGWDETINPNDIFLIADRILRKNGKMILFWNILFSLFHSTLHNNLLRRLCHMEA